MRVVGFNTNSGETKRKPAYCHSWLACQPTDKANKARERARVSLVSCSLSTPYTPVRLCRSHNQQSTIASTGPRASSIEKRIREPARVAYIYLVSPGSSSSSPYSHLALVFALCHSTSNFILLSLSLSFSLSPLHPWRFRGGTACT